jgi:predicted site-specific integrase-resolvase
MLAKAKRDKTTDAASRSGKLLGYARVSTTDQDLTVQRQAMKRAGRQHHLRGEGERDET